MRNLAGSALSACLLACGSTGTDSPEKLSFTRTLPLDEHGVRVTGGETSDLGGGSEGEPDPCGDVETERLSLEQARQLELPVDAKVAFLQETFEAPFRWGFGCDAGGNPLAEQDTRVRVHGEIVDVYRTTRAPLPNEPTTRECSDRLSYRFVFDLSTDDGQLSGRFYARTPRLPRVAGLVVSAAPDLRNFVGDLTLPIDLSRPHWAALRVDFVVNDDTGALQGSITPVLNYSDGGAAAFVAAGADTLGILGVAPLPEAAPWNPDCRFTPPAAPAAEPVVLSAYDGSREVPTCPVAASFWVSDGYLGNQYSARDSGVVKVEVDGVPLSVGWGIPESLGRLPDGAHVRVEMQSLVPGGMPHAALDFGNDGNGDYGYDAFDYCDGEGCTAAVEGVVEGYCSR
jgi:hypothetical protein